MQRTLLIGALVVVIALIAYLLLSALGIFPDGRGSPVDEVSPAAAANAEAKLSRLTAGGEEVRLTAVELTSLFQFRPEIWSIHPLRSPVVEMESDSIQLSGRLSSNEIPESFDIGPLRALLPDTSDVEIDGTVRSDGDAGTVLEIGSVEVAGMPIPPRLYSRFFEANSMTLPLPSGISSARVEDGALVLTP